MDWAKKNPHLLVLVLVAVGAVAASAMLVLNTQSFDAKFNDVRATVPKGTKVYQQAKDQIEAAKAEFQKPADWRPTQGSDALFVPAQYVIGDDGKPRKVTDDKVVPITYPPGTIEKIPNSWFLGYRMDPYTPGIGRADADNDGFWNESEYVAKTDPTDPKSHPPYTSRLFVKQFIRVPFLLKFQGYDGDPAKPDDFTVQINTITLRQPTAFLHIGDMVPKTNFKIQSAALKKVNDENGIEKDISEVTLLNIETNSPITLIYDKVVDSPDSFALFTYLHPQPAKEIKVKKLGEFILLPEKDVRYKLLDINEREALIQAPSGEKLSIPVLPAGYP